MYACAHKFMSGCMHYCTLSAQRYGNLYLLTDVWICLYALVWVCNVMCMVCVYVCVCVCVLKERKRIHTLVHPVAEQSVKGSLLSATHYLVALKLV